MRQVLAYKTLDIIVLISYRIGPEQTRLEMERVVRVFFEGFNQVKTSLMTTTSILQSPTVTTSATTTRLRSAFKARASIVSFDQASSRRFMPAVTSSSGGGEVTGGGHHSSDLNTSNALENANVDLSDSFDEYLKFSYDQTTNEIVGSSLRPSQAPPSSIGTANKRPSMTTSPESDRTQK